MSITLFTKTSCLVSTSIDKISWRLDCLVSVSSSISWNLLYNIFFYNRSKFFFHNRVMLCFGIFSYNIFLVIGRNHILFENDLFGFNFDSFLWLEIMALSIKKTLGQIYKHQSILLLQISLWIDFASKLLILKKFSTKGSRKDLVLLDLNWV